jgi:hypothetical protein
MGWRCSRIALAVLKETIARVCTVGIVTASAVGCVCLCGLCRGDYKRTTSARLDAKSGISPKIVVAVIAIVVIVIYLLSLWSG